MLTAQAGQFEKAYDDFANTIQLNPNFAESLFEPRRPVHGREQFEGRTSTTMITPSSSIQILPLPTVATVEFAN